MADEVTTFKQVSSLLNFAHPTGFVLDIPFKDIGIGRKLETIGYSKDRFVMNIQNFTLNRMSLGSNSLARTGYSVLLPNQTDTTEKSFTINYRLSSGWQQYYFLSLWYQSNLKNILHIDDEDAEERYSSSSDYFLTPINLWILDDNKDPAMLIHFTDCWLYESGEMQLSYTDNEPTLSHSFSCYYNDFKITLINERLGNT